ncbi:MAG: GNAT family N-acetyltransferase [Anaerolineales bacterium]|jgi:ribosomal protein S18 acetylase RimI-like enzyme
MDSPDENPALPTAPGLSWRSLQPVDAGLITALATTCLATDGGHLLGAADTYLQEHYLPTLPGASIGAFKKDGQLVACAAAHPTHTPEEFRTTIMGQVHPAYRRRGFGTFLLRWSIAEASRLLAACPPDRPHVLQLTTETLTEAAAYLFEQHRFTQQFAEDVMRRDLPDPLPDVLLPSGIRFATWAPALAGQFFAVYQAAFQERPGYPDWSQEKWLAWVATDDDFLSELSLLASHDDIPVGFIICADRWIVQMGVRPEWRERGIGSALVIEVLKRFQAAGGDHVLLDVNINNPRAARAYARLGFKQVGRRARYVRGLT